VNQKNKNWIEGIVVAVVLVLVAYYSRRYQDMLKSYIEQHPIWGIILYVLIGIIDAIAGPGLSIPLIPIAGHVWGTLGGALLTIAGWAGGSILAFMLVRHYGPLIIERFSSADKINRIKKYIPARRHLFWGIVLLRLVLPMDVFSFALGILTDVDLKTYATATLIGVAPSAILLSFLGTLPPVFEITGFIIGGAVFVWFLYLISRGPRTQHSP
jgi:uncharacterized membrane protein YdjX (TVP38/TMEM64 family)